MSISQSGREKRLRRLMLEMLKTNHHDRNHRYDSSLLASNIVVGLGFGVSPNDVMTLLEDLEARGYVKYRTITNKKTLEFWYVEIEITPRGRDVLEGTILDAAVESSE